MRKVLYTKYNKLRREEYRISTMICEDEHGKYVEKKALNSRSQDQIKNIYQNSLCIGKMYNQMEVLIPEYREEKVVFPYLSGESLENNYLAYLQDFDTLIEHIRQGLNVITDVDKKYVIDFQISEEFKKVFGDQSFKTDLKAFSLTNIDVLFDNIILKKGKYICLDCEWVFNFPIPIKFIEYRSLFYFYQKYEAYIKKQADLVAFLQMFNISEDEKNIFMDMERNFQMYVVGKDFENDYVYKYEKKGITLEESYEEKLQEEHEKNDRLTAQLETFRQELQQCREELESKYAHVKHLEGIVVEKSYSIDTLKHELDLKEQHVKNLMPYVKMVQSDPWFKTKRKLSEIKHKGNKKK